MQKYIVDLKQFKVIEQLGHGEFGDVFLVEKSITHERFAAKVSKKICTSTEDQVIFFSEVETLIKADNPAILKLIGFNLSDFNSKPYPTIIIEYLPGGTLYDMLDKIRNGNSPQEWNDTKKYINLLGIALGMKYLHAQKTAQRDLKPQNILFDTNLYPRITDFGFSKSLDELNSVNYMTSTKGSPLYMAPEIITGKPYTYKVDVYSYAIIAYEIITSLSPIPKGENGMLFVYQVPKGKRPDISTIKDKNITTFLSKCWSNDPNKRPTFSEIVDILKDPKITSYFNIDYDEVNKYIDLFADESHIIKPKSKKPEPETTMKKKIIKTNDLGMPLFRLVLVGDPCSCKTRIIGKLATKNFEKETPYIGSKYKGIIFQKKSGDFEVGMWDSSGEERFKSIFPLYMRGSEIAVICANANVEGSYKSIEGWLDLVYSNKTDDLELIYIAATNCIEGCVTDPEIIHQIADEHGIPFFATRFDDDSIKKMFDKIANDLANTFQINKNTDDDNDAANKKKSCLIY